MCNEAENMKRNCPSVKILERNTLPDEMVENCDTDIDGKKVGTKESCRKDDGHLTNRMMKFEIFVRL